VTQLAERHQVLVVGGGFAGLSVTKASACVDVDVTIVDRSGLPAVVALAMQRGKNVGRVMRAQVTGNGSVARMRSSGFTHHRGERSITLEQTKQDFTLNHLLQKWA
jgi:NADPH-dependent 2,4-dienoyl-CoA reductase/sulfur reductase-like enzyme